jgi:hypothetical protein
MNAEAARRADDGIARRPRIRFGHTGAAARGALFDPPRFSIFAIMNQSALHIAIGL